MYIVELEYYITVFDILLCCHIIYCLHNIVSGHRVLLLLKIDWLNRSTFQVQGKQKNICQIHRK